VIYVLTRTSGRPRFFSALRASLAEQTHRDFVHIVHSDDPTDAYVEGDIVIRGSRLHIDKTTGVYGVERYQQRLLDAIPGEGWIVFVDDDDQFTSPAALAQIAAVCTDPDTMPVWRVRREHGRVSPAGWGSDTTGICWEGAAFHTRHISRAVIDSHGGADGRFWESLAQLLTVEWHDFAPFEPQRSKGYGRRVDLQDPLITVAVPILGRPHRIPRMQKRFDDPRLDLLFLPDPTDAESLEVLETRDARYLIAPAAPDYGVPTFPSKINHAYRTTTTPFLLYVGDDVKPKSDWVRRALAHLEDEKVGLLATNDQYNRNVSRGLMATHGILRRTYVEEYGGASLPDAVGPVMHEGYRHNNCDLEISWVARQRGRFRYAPDVILTHERDDRADATYDLARSHLDRDNNLRVARIPCWPNIPMEAP